MRALASFGRRAAPPRSKRRWSVAALSVVVVAVLGAYFIASAFAAPRVVGAQRPTAVGRAALMVLRMVIPCAALIPLGINTS